MLVRRMAWAALALACTVALGACGTAQKRAPVEDRGMAPRGAEAAAPASNLPGAQNAGKPGYHTVQPGEGVMQIAREHNQNWRDIARWNNLDDPDHIEAGQVLRVEPPPGAAASAAASTQPAAPPKTASVAAAAPASSAPPPAALPPPAPPPADTVVFIWPAAGPVIAGYDEAKNNKGLDIAGKAGDPVLAAADGKVLYAGGPVRGYGNLIIIEHGNSFLTAYAHNQKLLVEEKQTVKKGQKIAEMGDSDADRVKLHFEIRRSGKPTDPARYLPPR
ncbi:MAG: peptidoglycan DD-metalloendopeptidase family protein [Burkholderiaceae bacterium]|nr:peptidoglycan DD-metalloendopeptidase family protein [Burkholderiaceae bacterium]